MRFLEGGGEVKAVNCNFSVRFLLELRAKRGNDFLFLLEAKRKRKSFLLRKEEKRTARQVTIFIYVLKQKTSLFTNPAGYAIIYPKRIYK